MQRNKIILFYPKPEMYGENLLPLNLMAIARMLDSKQYDIKIINATVENDYVDTILNEMKQGNVLCLGVTSMTGYQIHDALKVTKTVKRYFSDVPIIWGGYHPTLLPKETLMDDSVDIVVRGQGEITFKLLIENLFDKKSLDEISGISYKTAEGEVRHNPDRPFEDLNKFPSLPWQFVDDCYVKKDAQWGRTIEYFTSQGCPFNCGFCAEKIFANKQWVSLSSERVVNEIEMLKNKYSLDAIIVRDSNFFVSKNRVKNICEDIIKRKIQIKFIAVNARIDTLLGYNDEMLKLIYAAGFRDLLIGVESGSQKVLDMIDKRIKVSDTLEFFKKISQYNFSIFASLMIGLPGIDSKEEFEDTLDLLDQMLLYSRKGVSNSYIFHYTPYPGSFLYKRAIQYGFIAPDSLEQWSKMNLYNRKSPWVSSQYKKYVNYLSLYVLRRFFYPVQSRTHLIRLLYDKIIDPVFMWRWKHRYFDFFFEKQIIDSINFMGRLMLKFKKLKH